MRRRLGALAAVMAVGATPAIADDTAPSCAEALQIFSDADPIGPAQWVRDLTDEHGFDTVSLEIEPDPDFEHATSDKRCMIGRGAMLRVLETGSGVPEGIYEPSLTIYAVAEDTLGSSGNAEGWKFRTGEDSFSMRLTLPVTDRPRPVGSPEPGPTREQFYRLVDLTDAHLLVLLCVNDCADILPEPSLPEATAAPVADAPEAEPAETRPPAAAVAREALRDLPLEDRARVTYLVDGSPVSDVITDHCHQGGRWRVSESEREFLVRRYGADCLEPRLPAPMAPHDVEAVALLPESLGEPVLRFEATLVPRRSPTLRSVRLRMASEPGFDFFDCQLRARFASDDARGFDGAAIALRTDPSGGQQSWVLLETDLPDSLPAQGQWARMTMEITTAETAGNSCRLSEPLIVRLRDETGDDALTVDRDGTVLFTALPLVASKPRTFVFLNLHTGVDPTLSSENRPGLYPKIRPENVNEILIAYLEALTEAEDVRDGGQWLVFTPNDTGVMQERATLTQMDRYTGWEVDFLNRPGVDWVAAEYSDTRLVAIIETLRNEGKLNPALGDRVHVFGRSGFTSVGELCDANAFESVAGAITLTDLPSNAVLPIDEEAPGANLGASVPTHLCPGTPRHAMVFADARRQLPRTDLFRAAFNTALNADLLPSDGAAAVRPEARQDQIQEPK